jgi:hypothetical protein
MRRTGVAIPSPLVAWRFAAATGAMVAAIVLIAPFAPLSLLIATAAVVYIAVALLLRAFTPEDLALLREFRARGEPVAQ